MAEGIIIQAETANRMKSANDRLSEYSYFTRELYVEKWVIVLLVAEVVMMIAELLIMYAYEL